MIATIRRWSLLKLATENHRQFASAQTPIIT